MTPKLNDADRAAVDFLLNDAQAAATLSGRYAVPSPGADARRVDAVAGLLGQLDHIAVEEPPADLVDKTMRRVEREVAAHAIDVPALVDVGRPVA